MYFVRFLFRPARLSKEARGPYLLFKIINPHFWLFLGRCWTQFIFGDKKEAKVKSQLTLPVGLTCRGAKSQVVSVTLAVENGSYSNAIFKSWIIIINLKTLQVASWIWFLIILVFSRSKSHIGNLIMQRISRKCDAIRVWSHVGAARCIKVAQNRAAQMSDRIKSRFPSWKLGKKG